jgi:hypothetical protein
MLPHIYIFKILLIPINVRNSAELIEDNPKLNFWIGGTLTTLKKFRYAHRTPPPLLLGKCP